LEFGAKKFYSPYSISHINEILKYIVRLGDINIHSKRLFFTPLIIWKRKTLQLKRLVSGMSALSTGYFPQRLVSYWTITPNFADELFFFVEGFF
jgi:hypothetical protein